MLQLGFQILCLLLISLFKGVLRNIVFDRAVGMDFLVPAVIYDFTIVRDFIHRNSSFLRKHLSFDVIARSSDLGR